MSTVVYMAQYEVLLVSYHNFIFVIYISIRHEIYFILTILRSHILISGYLYIKLITYSDLIIIAQLFVRPHSQMHLFFEILIPVFQHCLCLLVKIPQKIQRRHQVLDLRRLFKFHVVLSLSLQLYQNMVELPLEIHANIFNLTHVDHVVRLTVLFLPFISIFHF